MRGIGITRALVEHVPETAIPLLVILTHIGDPVVVAGISTIVVWYGSRFNIIDPQDAPRLLVVTLIGLALVSALKGWFDFPRPPPNITKVVIDGSGFPSGHVLSSTIVFGAIAALGTWMSVQARYIIASGLVLLVALTRLALGVHYFVDVLVAAAIGIVGLYIGLHITTVNISFGLVAALVIGILALTGGISTRATLTLGGSIGVTAGWVFRKGDLLDTPPITRTILGSFLLAVVLMIYKVNPGPATVFVVGIVGGIGVVLTPIQKVSR
ncbi:MAG: phosphatase PAP2 family protein [Halobacteriaceae archaeon]